MPEFDWEEGVVEEYLDCTGAVRRFRLMIYAAGLFLDAREILGGEPIGLRFVERVGDDPGIAFGKIRDRIRERLAQRDVVRDARTGELSLLRDRLMGQIDSFDRSGDGPSVLVDDLELTWAEVGELLAPFEGFHVELFIRDVGGEEP